MRFAELDPREPFLGQQSNLEYEAWLDGTLQEDERESANGEMNAVATLGQYLVGQAEACWGCLISVDFGGSVLNRHGVDLVVVGGR